MTTRATHRISFICSGNICRSPMGAVILRHLLDGADQAADVEVDSVGTGDWHVGHPADPRTLRTLERHGYDGTSHRAQQVDHDWVASHDLVLAADRGHLAELRRGAPEGMADRVRLLREFDPEAVDAGELEVDDPYFGDEEDFERCLVEVERACRGLVDHLRDQSDQGDQGDQGTASSR